MLSTGTPVDWAWVDVAVPRPSTRLPGVSMAGFRQRAPAPLVDIAMVAHPSVTLLFDLSEGEGIVYDMHGRHERGSVVIGLLPGDLRAACRGTDCLQIRLEPAVAAAVFGASTELSGTMAALADLWGREARRAEHRLRAAASWDERFRIALELIGRRLDARRLGGRRVGAGRVVASGLSAGGMGAGRPDVGRRDTGRLVDPEIVHAWRRTLASRGRVRVDRLADEVGWSRDRLWSRFRSQLGITPKRAARLVRFDHAAHLLAAGHAPAVVATESGYVDQSHLHREVKEFAALTPTAVAAAPWLAIDDVAWPGS
jgi:AraC-like DNA-binding protein